MTIREIDSHDSALPLAAVLDALPIVAFLARPDGSVSYVSRGWIERIGVDPREALGDAYPALFHPDHRRRVVAAWQAAITTSTPYRDEFLLRFGDGRHRWVLCAANPLHDPVSGDVAGWFGTLTDIDEHKRTEASLRAQAEFEERLIESSDDCILIVDLDGRVVWMSRHGQAMLGIADFEPVIGRSWFDFWDARTRVDAQAALAAGRSGQTGKFTGVYRDRDRACWFDVVVTAIENADGRPDTCLVVLRDVTGVRAASEALDDNEQRFTAFSETLPGVFWSATPAGDLDFISERWSSTRGVPMHEAFGSGWLRFVHPLDRDAARTKWQACVASGSVYDTVFRAQLADGRYRWQLVRARPQRDANGTIVRWVGVNIDIDDQRRADQARAMFVALVENSSDLIAIVERSGRVAFMNEAGRTLLGVDSLEAVRATRAADYLMADDRAFVDATLVPALRNDGRWIGDFRFRNARTGLPIPVAANIFALRGPGGKVDGYATVSRDERQRRRLDVGLKLLSETGAAVVDSLDVRTTLASVAQAFTRGFAAYCIIEVATADGGWEPTYAHRRADRLRHLDALAAPVEPHPIVRAMRHGESSVVRIGDDPLEAVGGHRDRRDALVALGITSFITVPVVLPDGEIVGGLTCARDVEDADVGDFTSADLPFVQEVGRRAGAAFANARIYERERRIAVELQAASLPATLPRLANLQLDAEYRPGSDEATIGGDWYDAFTLADGRIAISMGDVLGHGLGAAVTMTKLRQAMQAAAMVEPDPAVMLSVADTTLRLIDADGYATAIAAIYDPVAMTLTMASAGHPGPVIRLADGTIASPQPPNGLMLGLRTPSIDDACCVVTVELGAAMVFFTDGLVEATRNYRVGLDALHAAIADPAVYDHPMPARAIVHRVLGATAAGDDIAVLVVQIRERRS